MNALECTTKTNMICIKNIKVALTKKNIMIIIFTFFWWWCGGGDMSFIAFHNTLIYVVFIYDGIIMEMITKVLTVILFHSDIVLTKFSFISNSFTFLLFPFVF